MKTSDGGERKGTNRAMKRMEIFLFYCLKVWNKFFYLGFIYEIGKRGRKGRTEERSINNFSNELSAAISKARGMK